MIGLLLAGLAIAFVAVAMLTFAVLKKWFRENTTVDRDNVRAVLQEAMANGDYKVIQCGFNRRLNKITAIKAYEAENRDRELIETGPEAIIHEEC